MFSVDWHSDFDAVQRRGRGSIEMGQECPQPSKVPFRVDGKPAVSLLGAVAKFAVVHSMGREHTWSGWYSLAQRVFCLGP